MRRSFACVAAASVLGAIVFTTAAAQQPRTTAADSTITVDEMIRAVRADMQSTRADIIAKNITLTSEQAAKFWPVFNAYQNEQNGIMDEQMRGIQKYADTYEKLDDAGALALMNAHLVRDGNMNALRQKYLGEFQKVLPARTAVRVIQIDRRLSLLAQLELASKIPVVH